jgi:hypothetical protein
MSELCELQVCGYVAVPATQNIKSANKKTGTLLWVETLSCVLVLYSVKGALRSAAPPLTDLNTF